MSDAPPSSTESILFADLGSVATKVGLIDRVGDSYRLIGAATARTTAAPPQPDVSQGLRRALALLESRLARRLSAADGRLLTPEQPSGDGVDAFVAATSAPPPLRITLLGLSREISMASARRAVAGAFAVVESAIAIDEETARWGAAAHRRAKDVGGPSQAVTTLIERRPEVIVVVGGLDGGAIAPLAEIANIVAAVCAAVENIEERPWVVFAGNREARSVLAARLGPLAELRTVDNVRPSYDHEDLAPLQAELAHIYQERRMRILPGLESLSSWSPVPVISTAQALENVARFLARRYSLNVLAADVGAAMTSLVGVRGERVIRASAGDMGALLGPQVGAAPLLAEILDWVPGKISTDDAHATLLNQALRPWTVPLTLEAARVLHAASQIALSHAASEWRAGPSELLDDIDLCLMGGAPVARGCSYGGLALMALDALQLCGIVTLAVDPTGLAPALGAVAAVSPEAAAQVVERDGYVTIGTLIAPLSGVREGSPALRVMLRTERGGSLDIDVQGGAIELIPLGIGERATVEIRPERGVELGGGAQRDGSLRREMEGGALGLIIDARGRPLFLPPAADRRRDKLQQWIWDVGG